MKTTELPKTLVWFITGTSQGFGNELVRCALQRGDFVVATSRNPEKVQASFRNASARLLAIPMDLRSEEAVKIGIQAAISRFSRIDVLVNNAGHGLLGAVEEANNDEVRDVYETNVFGLLRVIRAALPHLRKQRSGHIVNLSSIGGLVGLPGWGIYNSTKFAVEGLSEALAAELIPMGIRVTAIEPGPFRTDFLGGSLARTSQNIPDYDESAGKTRTYAIEHNGVQPGNPALAAKAIVTAVTFDNPPSHLLLGQIAYEQASAKLIKLQEEFEKWRDVAFSSDFSSPIS